MAFTKDEFLTACSYLTSTGDLVGTGALFIDGNTQTVIDEGNSNQNITPDEATLTQALIDSDASELLISKDNENGSLTKCEIKGYLKRQLVIENPNLSTIKSTIENAITDNAELNQAITNIAALYGYDKNTAVGYVRCALLAVTIFSS